MCIHSSAHLYLGSPLCLVCFTSFSGWWYTYPSEKYEFVGITILVWKNQFHYSQYMEKYPLSDFSCPKPPVIKFTRQKSAECRLSLTSHGPVAGQPGQLQLAKPDMGRTGKPTWKSTSVPYLLILEGNTRCPYTSSDVECNKRFTQNPSVRKTLLSFVWWKPGELTRFSTSFRQVLAFTKFSPGFAYSPGFHQVLEITRCSPNFENSPGFHQVFTRFWIFTISP